MGDGQQFHSCQAVIWSEGQSGNPSLWTKVPQGTWACVVRCPVPGWRVIHPPPASGLGRQAKGGVSGWSSSWRTERSRGRRNKAKGWQDLWDVLKWHFYVFVSTLMSLKWRQANRKMTWLCYHHSHFPDIENTSFTLGASAVPHLRTFSPHWWAFVVLARSTAGLELAELRAENLLYWRVQVVIAL